MEPALEKLNKERKSLERAMEDAREARSAFEGDFVLQLLSFRQKGILQQSAFVLAILVTDQVGFQLMKVIDDRGGSLPFALGGIATVAALVWFYGYRPFPSNIRGDDL